MEGTTIYMAPEVLRRMGELESVVSSAGREEHGVMEQLGGFYASLVTKFTWAVGSIMYMVGSVVHGLAGSVVYMAWRILLDGAME